MAVPALPFMMEFTESTGIEVIVLDLNHTDEERKITEAVGGKLVKKYKLRDWVFQKQKAIRASYLPIVFRDENHKSFNLVADSELPVRCKC